MKVSIITLLYRGRKYVNNLKTMIEAAAKMASDIAEVEWVISNDDPGEVVEHQYL